MNRIASIALILLMSLQCFYELGVITYFEINRDYIAKVLCINRDEPITMCHGQCFLDRNLDMADVTTTDEGTIPLSAQSVDFPIFLITENCYSFQPSTLFETRSAGYLSSTSSAHGQAPFHPPPSLS